MRRKAEAFLHLNGHVPEIAAMVHVGRPFTFQEDFNKKKKQQQGDIVFKDVKSATASPRLPLMKKERHQTRRAFFSDALVSGETSLKYL